jgi:hypothetical protein
VTSKVGRIDRILRFQQRRGQRLPPGVRSVARPSRWGNPYRLTNEAERAEVLARYQRWLDDRLAADPSFLDPLQGATGLACYCAPDVACHADTLIERLAGGGERA